MATLPVDDVTLLVNGMKYEGWQSVQVRRSLKALCGSFELSVTDQWTEQKAPWRIMPGDQCVLKVGSETVITGYVDRTSPSFDKDSRNITVCGRDTASDIVDCSAINRPGYWAGISFITLTKALLNPFKVGVVVDPSAKAAAGKVFASIVLQPGESPQEILHRYAQISGVLLTNDGSGNVVITNTGTSRASNDLVQGENLLRGCADFDHKDRFSQYIVNAQGSNFTDPGEVALAFALQGKCADGGVKRFRPKVLQIEGAADSSRCTLRARWEANVRAAKAARFNVLVQGWRQKDGSLWRFNQIVRLKSNWLGVNMDFLICDVTLHKGSDGTLTELGLERADAYKPDPTLIDKNEGYLQAVLADRQRGG